jgi:D-sedoheptulose 7-phosphate isomerase
MAAVSETASAIVNAYQGGGKTLLCGNGGSAADAQHLAAEMVGRFKRERRALPAVALTVNTSVLTALSNDYNFDTVFVRQVEALARPGDVLVGISTSGRSRNVNLALARARELGAVTVGLLGGDGGQAKELCDIALTIPSDDTPRIQEAHILIGHIICDLVERTLFEQA